MLKSTSLWEHCQSFAKTVPFLPICKYAYTGSGRSSSGLCPQYFPNFCGNYQYNRQIQTKRMGRASKCTVAQILPPGSFMKDNLHFVNHITALSPILYFQPFGIYRRCSHLQVCLEPLLMFPICSNYHLSSHWHLHLRTWTASLLSFTSACTSIVNPDCKDPDTCNRADLRPSFCNCTETAHTHAGSRYRHSRIVTNAYMLYNCQVIRLPSTTMGSLALNWISLEWSCKPWTGMQPIMNLESFRNGLNHKLEGSTKAKRLEQSQILEL